MSSFIRRRLWIAVLLPVVLAAAGDCSESGVKSDIKDVLGLNVDDPGQVAGAIFLGHTFGDDQESQAADVADAARPYQRATHDANGDRAFDRGDLGGAATEYRQALRWTDDKTDPGIRANLNGKLGSTLDLEAEKTADGGQQRSLYLQAANAYGNAAALETGYDREVDLSNQGNALITGGNYGGACATSKKMTDGFRVGEIVARLAALHYTCR